MGKERTSHTNPSEVAGSSSSSKSPTPPKPQSKRQQVRQLQTNDLNRLPQQPRIKSAEKRERTDVLQSGIAATSGTNVWDPTLDLEAPEIQFGRSLGSSDPRRRHRAVNCLERYLRARCDPANADGGLTEVDMMKLWKGLWYCLYMADKVPVQDEVSKRLVKLLWCFSGTKEEDEHAAKVYMEIFCSGDDDDDEEEDEFHHSDHKDEDCEDFEGASDEDSDDEVAPELVDFSKNKSQKPMKRNDTKDDVEDTKGIVDDDKAEGVDTDDEDDEDDDDDDMEVELDENEEFDESQYKHCRGAHLSQLFVRTFFVTTRREWGKMDKYRVDKFYTLIRMIISEVYKYMAKRDWNLGIVRLFNDALDEEVLTQIPNGIRYHIIDLALDELAKVNSSEASCPLTDQSFLDVMEPFLALCQFANDSTLHKRIVDGIFLKFLETYSTAVNHGKTKEGKDGNNGNDGLVFKEVNVAKISEYIFKIASDPKTLDKHRETLYDTYKIFERKIQTMDCGTIAKNESQAEDTVGVGNLLNQQEASESPKISSKMRNAKDKKDKNHVATESKGKNDVTKTNKNADRDNDSEISNSVTQNEKNKEESNKKKRTIMEKLKDSIEEDSGLAQNEQISVGVGKSENNKKKRSKKKRKKNEEKVPTQVEHDEESKIASEIPKVNNTSQNHVENKTSMDNEGIETDTKKTKREEAKESEDHLGASDHAINGASSSKKKKRKRRKKNLSATENNDKESSKDLDEGTKVVKSDDALSTSQAAKDVVTTTKDSLEQEESKQTNVDCSANKNETETGVDEKMKNGGVYNTDSSSEKEAMNSSVSSSNNTAAKKVTKKMKHNSKKDMAKVPSGKKKSAVTKTGRKSLVNVNATKDVGAVENGRRVKFGETSRAKSHAASMRALKKAAPPSTALKSPEKGILRKNTPTKKKL